MAPNILLAPHMTQNAERKHRTQDANTAHFRSSFKEIIIPYIVTGFGGNPRLADVGGVPYLMPLVQREKVSGLCVQSHRMFFKYDVVAMSEIPGWWGRIHEY